MKIFALVFYILAAILPLYWIIVTSLKGPKEIYTFPIQYLPKIINFDSYRNLFATSNFGKYFLNSSILSLSSSFAVLSLTIFSGYALSRYDFKFKSKTFIILFFIQAIPSFAIFLPLYTTFAKWGMVDKLSTLLILYTCKMIVFGMIMAKSFFDRIPISLEEAAQIDGCNRIQALFKIVLPLTMPGIASIFSFIFINSWNELFLAVMFINSNDKMTIPVALNSFISKTDVSWDIMSAGLVIALLPSMLIFAFAQRYIVAGLMGGAVKG